MAAPTPFSVLSETDAGHVMRVPILGDHQALMSMEDDDEAK